MEREADAEWMQRVATEMNLPETAFVRPIEDGFELRWFTPTVEIDLCGHATLASAHVLWETTRLATDQTARFHTRSGILEATKAEQIRLDFPAEPPHAAELPHEIPGLNPIWTGQNRMDWIVELESENDLFGFVPNFDRIAALGKRGLQVTARASSEFDFVSRFFGPQSGINEDPVTGSAHCCLGPYWGEKLGKKRLTGYQASARGGVVGVELCGERLGLFGDAVTTLEGVLRC